MGMFDHLPDANSGTPAAGAASGGLFDHLPDASAQKPAPGFLERVSNVFTGADRTQYPDAPEFHTASAEFTPAQKDYMAANPYPQGPGLGVMGHIKAALGSQEETRTPEQIAWTQQFEKLGSGVDTDKVARSAITSDATAQLEILKKQIPGLEVKPDKFGNIMLKTPQMKEWAYLNKPGVSARDIDELGTQTLATLPLLGMGGAGGNIPTRIATGFLGGVGAEAEKNLLAKAQGSTQDLTPGEVLTAGAFGGALAPGVPTATLQRGAQIASNLPIVNTIRGAINPELEASRRVAVGYQNSLATRRAAGLQEAERLQAAGDVQGAQRVLRELPPERPNPEMLQHRAGGDFQTRDAREGAFMFPGNSTNADIMGQEGGALARSAANSSPAARQILEDTLSPRHEAQAQRALNFLDNNVGGAATLANADREALNQLAHNARGQFYDAAFNQPAALAGIVRTPEIAAVHNSPAGHEAYQRALETIQNRAAAGRLRTQQNGTTPNTQTLEFWDEVKRNLQDEYKRLVDRNPSQAGHIQGITDRLVAELDRQVPQYQQARGVSHGIFRANNALDAGENFARPGTGISLEEARRALDPNPVPALGRGPMNSNFPVSRANPAPAMTQQERELFAHGYLQSKIEQMQRVSDRSDLAGRLLSSPEERARMSIALGPDLTRDFVTFLEHERMMAGLYRAVSGNSTTARQLMEMGLAGGAAATLTGDPTNMPAWVAGAVAAYGKRRLGVNIDQRVAQQVATQLMSRDPSIMRRGAQVAQGYPQYMQVLRALDAELGGTAGARVLRNAVGQEANGVE